MNQMIWFWQKTEVYSIFCWLPKIKCSILKFDVTKGWQIINIHWKFEDFLPNGFWFIKVFYKSIRFKDPVTSFCVIYITCLTNFGNLILRIRRPFCFHFPILRIKHEFTVIYYTSFAFLRFWQLHSVYLGFFWHSSSSSWDQT